MSGRDEKRDRGARLAEALRENLRRRKAQARGRREPTPPLTGTSGNGAAGQEPAGSAGKATGAAGQGSVDPAGLVRGPTGGASDPGRTSAGAATLPGGRGEGGASGTPRD